MSKDGSGAMEAIDVSYVRRCTIGDAFSRVVNNYRAKTCVVFKERSWTYGQLNDAVNKVANNLIDLGYEKGDRIAAYGRNSDAYIILMLACARAGVINVPVNFGLAGKELKYVLAQCGAKAIFADHGVLDSLAQSGLGLGPNNTGTLYGGGDRDILGLSMREGRTDAPPAFVSGEDTAQIIYTSGTTALPKGVVMTNASLLETHRSSISYLGFSEKTKGISALPFYHMVFHVNCLPYLLSGACQVVLDYADVGNIMEVIEKEKINSLFLPPTVIVKLLSDERINSYDLRSLAQLIYGASSMPASVLKELKTVLPETKLYHIYGQTEAGLVSVLSPDQHEMARGSVGRPVFNFDTRIVDSDMNAVSVGQPGELVHQSPSLMKGYWNNQAETEQVFGGGWFHSGDFGYRDERGYIYIVDRIKDVINTGGVLVSSREVEDQLFSHQAVNQVAVFAVPHPVWIEAVVAAVVMNKGVCVTESDLIDFLKIGLGKFKLPKRIIFLDELPVNPSGKVLKRTLREKFSKIFD